MNIQNNDRQFLLDILALVLQIANKIAKRVGAKLTRFDIGHTNSTNSTSVFVEPIAKPDQKMRNG